MATELQANKNASDAVEPSTAARPQQSFIARLENRIQKLPCGRYTLGCLQWCVAAALVLSGFYGAEVVNSGMELAMRNDTTTNSAPIIVAAASPTVRE